MAFLLIPTVPATPHYKMRTRLDGREYVFEVQWNEREDRWYLHILDAAEQPLALGIKLITNFPLIRFYQWDPRLPPGDLRVACSVEDKSPPGFEDLGIGRRCELVYVPTTEV